MKNLHNRASGKKGKALREQTLNVAEQRMEIERLSEKGDAWVEDDLIQYPMVLP